jgi:hypothetical protein
MPLGPSDSDVDQQLRLIGAEDEFRTQLTFELLTYLIRIQREGRYSSTDDKPTGGTILFEFYEHHFGRSNPHERHENKGQHKDRVRRSLPI